jgi:hypothetical protein
VTATLARSDISLELVDGKGNLVDAVDNSNSSAGSARLTTAVDPGAYYVVAKSFSGLGGSYTIAVK